MNDIPEWFEESAQRNRERINDFLKREKEERIQKLRKEVDRLQAEIDRLEGNKSQLLLTEPKYLNTCICQIKEEMR